MFTSVITDSAMADRRLPGTHEQRIGVTLWPSEQQLNTVTTQTPDQLFSTRRAVLTRR